MCHPPAGVLHGRLIALAHSARSFARALVGTQIQSVVLLLYPTKHNAPRNLRCLSEKKKKMLLFRESSIRPFPVRRRSVALLLRRRMQPPAGAVLSTQTETAPEFGLWWRLPSHTSIPIEHWCARPLLPRKARESLVTMPNAPRTTQLYRHA